MERITVILEPEPTRVAVLVRGDGQELMKAVLGSSKDAHPRAHAALLEGLALWRLRPFGIVEDVDRRSDGHALDLFDALGLGDFRDLRRIDVAEVAR